MVDVLNRRIENEGNQPPIPKSPDPFFERIAKLSLLGLLVYWSFVIVRPFLTLVLWSLILTVALYPAFDWTARRLGGRRKLAAVIITLVSLAVVTGPLVWLGLSMVEGLGTLSQRLDAGAITIPPPPDEIRAWPIIGEPVHQIWNLASANLKSGLTEALLYLDPLRSFARKMAQSAATGIPIFLASLLTTGFLFAPAPKLLESGRKLSRRILPVHGLEYVKLAGATIRNVSQGVIGVSLLQATLAGLGFFVAGIPGSGLLALAVLVFGILQFPGLVILPAMVWSWTVLTLPAAIVLTAYLLPVSLINNVLSPIVMAHGLQTPMIVIFIGVLGGAIAHGVIGLFVGPIILAVSWELVLAWFQQEDVSLSLEGTPDT
jgi:predicted PurR-regulated permease PerM